MPVRDVGLWFNEKESSGCDLCERAGMLLEKMPAVQQLWVSGSLPLQAGAWTALATSVQSLRHARIPSLSITPVEVATFMLLPKIVSLTTQFNSFAVDESLLQIRSIRKGSTSTLKSLSLVQYGEPDFFLHELLAMCRALESLYCRIDEN